MAVLWDVVELTILPMRLRIEGAPSPFGLGIEAADSTSQTGKLSFPSSSEQF